MYVNIAMPAVLVDDTLEWVDLDLDYRMHLDGSIQLMDEDEFQQNQQRLNYPPALIEQARPEPVAVAALHPVVVIEQVHAACREVEHGLKQKNFPFDYEHQVKRYRQVKRNLTSKL